MLVETLFLLSAANAECSNCVVANASALPVVVGTIDIKPVNVAKPSEIYATGQVQIEYRRNIFGKLVPVRAVQNVQKAKAVKSAGSTCKSCNK